MMTADTVDSPCSLKLRRSVATPFYVLALILSYLSDAIGKFAAIIAGDPN
jgi:hypothetical protein